MDKVKLNVPLIQQDLSNEETILQIAFSLDCLESVVECVFTKLENRLDNGRKRLNQLQSRCHRAKEKVDKLKGINKSITVYSCAKYPVPFRNCFFEDVDFTGPLKEDNIVIRSGPQPPNKLSFKEKMKFYHVKDSTQLLRKNEEITPFEGLGEVPENVDSICSLLLYNTSTNIYDTYKIIDSLAAPKAAKLQIKSRDGWKPELEPAPASLTSREILRHNLSNYLYVPISQDVPDIRVPTDLPHLPGIAGDLRYEENVNFHKEEPAAVPEPPHENKVPLVPNLVPEEEEEEEAVTLVQNLPRVEERVGPTPPPPPPPPPVEVPPPPPPIEATPPPPPPAALDDSRANLMAAIRAAGGKATLKPAQRKEAPPPTSFMDDLHDKLKMRRKGILGKSEGGGVGMLQEIATMIPPPPDTPEASSAEDDPEWDD